MRSYIEVVKRLKPYRKFEMRYFNYGYIAWHYGTGENVEILLIEAKEPGNGDGRRLLNVLKYAIKPKPYHSVYVFRRAINEEAGKFYRAVGFKETIIKGLYKDEDAVLGVIKYEDL